MVAIGLGGLIRYIYKSCACLLRVSKIKSKCIARYCDSPIAVNGFHIYCFKKEIIFSKNKLNYLKVTIMLKYNSKTISNDVRGSVTSS